MIKLRAFVPECLVASDAALARIAIIRDAITRLQLHSVATQMLAGVDHYVGQAFKKPPEATARPPLRNLLQRFLQLVRRKSDKKAYRRAYMRKG
jgi:hypothetical protein